MDNDEHLSRDLEKNKNTCEEEIDIDNLNDVLGLERAMNYFSEKNMTYDEITKLEDKVLCCGDKTILYDYMELMKGDWSDDFFTKLVMIKKIDDILKYIECNRNDLVLVDFGDSKEKKRDKVQEYLNRFIDIYLKEYLINRDINLDVANKEAEKALKLMGDFVSFYRDILLGEKKLDAVQRMFNFAIGTDTHLCRYGKLEYKLMTPETVLNLDTDLKCMEEIYREFFLKICIGQGMGISSVFNNFLEYGPNMEDEEFILDVLSKLYLKYGLEKLEHLFGIYFLGTNMAYVYRYFYEECIPLIDSVDMCKKKIKMFRG